MRATLLAKALWRHHRTAVLLTLAGAVAATVAVASWGEDAGEADRPSRSLLNRVWLDRMPETPRDEVGAWIWLAGGIGAYQQGSSFRGSYDVFEFERNGRALAMTFLQDGESVTTDFRIESCDELPPFDLCLTLRATPRGASRYYAFSSHDDALEHVPWSGRLLAAARAAAD